MFLPEAVFSATESVTLSRNVETRFLIHIGNIDSDSDCYLLPPLAVGDRNRHSVGGGLAFIVQGNLGLELPGGGNNAKRGSIRATQSIDEGIIISIGRSNRSPDVCA